MLFRSAELELRFQLGGEVEVVAGAAEVAVGLAVDGEEPAVGPVGLGNCGVEDVAVGRAIMYRTLSPGLIIGIGGAAGEWQSDSHGCSGSTCGGRGRIGCAVGRPRLPGGDIGVAGGNPERELGPVRP